MVLLLEKLEHLEKSLLGMFRKGMNMAHWAKIDKNGIVIQVLVTDNQKPNEGLDWLQQRFPGKWVKTSYNTYGNKHLLGGEPLRKNFAGKGYTYDTERDAFIPPKPFESWKLDEETCLWIAPKPKPEHPAIWDEDKQDWIEFNSTNN